MLREVLEVSRENGYEDPFCYAHSGRQVMTIVVAAVMATCTLFVNAEG